MSAGSALYVGSVMHRRLRPRVHRLRYRVFWMLLDLDAIDALAGSLRSFSHNAFNAVSFYDADHGDGSVTALRPQVERHLRDAGIALDGGTISLLCMPRIFGYGFNPLSIYFCHRPDGTLAAILYEVHNTFGERHCYLIAVEPDAEGVVDQECRKMFYVSPFMDMDIRYSFRVSVAAERITVAIQSADGEGPILVAALSGRRVTLTDGALLRLLLTHPLLPLKVMAAIHWHALRMWLRGFRLRSRPKPPAMAVTIVNANTAPP